MAETFPMYFKLNKTGIAFCELCPCVIQSKWHDERLVWNISGDARPFAGAVAGGGVGCGSSQGRGGRLSRVRMPSQGSTYQKQHLLLRHCAIIIFMLSIFQAPSVPVKLPL
jgi:hypothetical protein